MGTFPETERQARPLAKLDRSNRLQPGKRSSRNATRPGVPVTAAAVEKVVESYQAQDQSQDQAQDEVLEDARTKQRTSDRRDAWEARRGICSVRCPFPA